jgi:integration host factor subunit alpha
MTLTKAHIIERLFAKNLFTKGESAQIVDALSADQAIPTRW